MSLRPLILTGINSWRGPCLRSWLELSAHLSSPILLTPLYFCCCVAAGWIAPALKYGWVNQLPSAYKSMEHWSIPFAKLHKVYLGSALSPAPVMLVTYDAPLLQYEATGQQAGMVLYNCTLSANNCNTWQLSASDIVALLSTGGLPLSSLHQKLYLQPPSKTGSCSLTLSGSVTYRTPCLQTVYADSSAQYAAVSLTGAIQVWISSDHSVGNLTVLSSGRDWLWYVPGSAGQAEIISDIQAYCSPTCPSNSFCDQTQVPPICVCIYGFGSSASGTCDQQYCSSSATLCPDYSVCFDDNQRQTYVCVAPYVAVTQYGDYGGNCYAEQSSGTLLPTQLSLSTVTSPTVTLLLSRVITNTLGWKEVLVVGLVTLLKPVNFPSLSVLNRRVEPVIVPTQTMLTRHAEETLQ